MDVTSSAMGACKRLNIRDQMVVAGLVEHEVHVARPVSVSLEDLEELTNWTVSWDRVGHRDLCCISLPCRDGVLATLRQIKMTCFLHLRWP